MVSGEVITIIFNLEADELFTAGELSEIEKHKPGIQNKDIRLPNSTQNDHSFFFPPGHNPKFFLTEWTCLVLGL